MKIAEMLSIVVVVFWSSLATGQVTYNSVWEASSGKLPDSLCPGWNLTDAADPENPQISGGALTVSTSDTTENMWYDQIQPVISIIYPLIIEARIKYVSGVLPNPRRTGVAISFQTGYNVGNVLWIRGDQIFLWSGQDVVGPTANVDTTRAFHTYRIEVTNTGAITIFYDDSPVLSGSTYSDPHWYYSQTIWWGDGTFHAAGTSQWEYFKHNACGVCGDFDSDGVVDSCDNCPKIFNPTQSDTNQSGFGDACDDSCLRQKPGDVDGSGTIDNSDLVLLIDITHCLEPMPTPGANADFDGNCIVDTADVRKLTTYLFMGFPQPAQCTCVNPELHVTCQNMCNNSTTDPVFLICPGGDAPFRAYLRNPNGTPVVGDTSVYIQFNACDGIHSCPLSRQQSNLYPIGPSDADGVVTFYYPGGGCDNSCTATIITWCGILATVPVKSFDINTDFGVSLTSDYDGSLCNDYNGNGSVDFNDQALFDQHLDHFCGLTPCQRFGSDFRLTPESNLTPGQQVALELSLSNNNFDSCSIGFIGFYASGFGTGQGTTLITNYAYNKSLAPGERDTVTVNYTVPGIGHGCLSAKFATSCCSTDVELVQCAQSTWRCFADTNLCYQFNIHLDQLPVDSIRRFHHFPPNWSRIDDHIPSAFPLNLKDSVFYRICSPVLANLGDTAASYVYVYAGGNPMPRRFVNKVAITSRTGDCDGNCLVNISDAVHVINYIFSGGPEPKPYISGDVDCNTFVNISDAVFLINYIFSGGPPPCLIG